MASSPRKRRLSLKARQALELLAVDQRGLAEALLLTYGSSPVICSPASSTPGLQQHSGRPSKLAARR